MLRTLRSGDTCGNCGQKINFMHDEFTNRKFWAHHTDGSTFCRVSHKSLTAIPISEKKPSPDPDGDTACDDLIGQLAMMQEFIDTLRNRMLQTDKGIDLNEFMDLWGNN